MIEGSEQRNPTPDQPTAVKEGKKALIWRDYVHVVNVAHQPKFTYDRTAKRFEIYKVTGTLVKGTVIGRASDLTLLFRTRYDILYDRIMRNDRFQMTGFRPVSFTNAGDGPKIDRSITLVKNMLGRDGDAFLLMGLISYGSNGKLWLQDYTGKIELDVSQTSTLDEAYFCPGMFVLCDGVYQNQVFYMNAVVQPPGERRTATKQFYGNIDLIGVHTRKPISAGSTMSMSEGRRPADKIDKEFERELTKLEKELEGNRILFLGGSIHLDNVYVCDALRKLFKLLVAEVEDGEMVAPVAIVFPGSFVSYPFTPTGMSSLYKDLFDQLTVLLEEYFGKDSPLRKTKLVFLPGQNDPWNAAFAGGATTVWPVHPISKIFTNRVSRACPNAIFSTNPSRIAYLSQEIVVVRDDYGERFRRNEIDFINKTDDSAMQVDTNDPTNVEDDVGGDTDDDDDDESAVRRDLSRLMVQNRKEVKPTATRAFTPDVAEARKVIKTILCQAHLAPSVLDLHPVAWSQDYCLQMPMLPNALCLVDSSTPQFAMTYEGCHTINPGVFLQQGKINWMEYYPHHQRSEVRFLYC